MLYYPGMPLQEPNGGLVKRNVQGRLWSFESIKENIVYIIIK